MEIKTKYDLGDNVWIIDDNHKVVRVRINDIYILYDTSVSQLSIYGEILIIRYKCGNCSRREECIFPTKEELLKSL